MSIALFWALVGGGIVLALASGVWCAVYLPAIVRQKKAAKREVQVASMRAAVLAGAEIEQVYARSVDRIDISGITDTGLTTAIKRYEFQLEFWWTDTAGQAHHIGPNTYTWPNDLSDVPTRIVKEWAVQLVTQAVRWRLGLEPYPDG